MKLKDAEVGKYYSMDFEYIKSIFVVTNKNDIFIEVEDIYSTEKYYYSDGWRLKYAACDVDIIEITKKDNPEYYL